MKIWEHWVDYNESNTFFLVVDYEVFPTFVILLAGWNEIETNIVSCRICLVARREGKSKNTKWENSRDRHKYMALNM